MTLGDGMMMENSQLLAIEFDGENNQCVLICQSLTHNFKIICHNVLNWNGSLYNSREPLTFLYDELQ